MDRRTYLALLRSARKQSRSHADAEDLLQTALVVAIEAGRGDLARSDNRRWLVGVLRNLARHEARTAVRRRRREGDFQSCGEGEPALAGTHEQAVRKLPPALRVTTLLALTGHTRGEIGWLLNLSDTALRKRISDIRRRWNVMGEEVGPAPGAPDGDLSYGRIRQALIGRVRGPGLALGSHDPDGNLFVVTSQSVRLRQPRTSDI